MEDSSPRRIETVGAVKDKSEFHYELDGTVPEQKASPQYIGQLRIDGVKTQSCEQFCLLGCDSPIII
jgi:hypothetical protein